MPTCDFTIETESLAATQALGAALAPLLRGGDVLALSGELGAGKTALTQGIARGLGIARPVTSPTFVLVNQYALPGGNALHHVDCYRLANAPLEMWDVGLSDLFGGDDIVVIEWANRISELLPESFVEVAFTYLDDSSRRLCWRGHGARGAAIVAELAAVTAQ